jgi:DNA-binding transcriptional LysR family regulator
MAKAAEQLAISKPVISKTISDLEHALGVRLLERDRHGAEPTIYGAALLKRGAAVFDELRAGVKEIEFLADPGTGEVRIGCSATLAASFVSAVIDHLSRHHPRMVFQLVTTQAATHLAELSERNVDLLITRRLGSASDGRLAFEFLFDESYVIAVGARHPGARRRKIALADLVSEPWVLPPPHTVIGSIATEAFRANRLAYPRATVFTDRPEVRINLLATGRFVSIFSASSLRLPIERPEVKVLPIELPLARAPIGITTLKNRTVNPAARLFIECAREFARRSPEPTG